MEVQNNYVTCYSYMLWYYYHSLYYHCYYYPEIVRSEMRKAIFFYLLGAMTIFTYNSIQDRYVDDLWYLTDAYNISQLTSYDK